MRRAQPPAPAPTVIQSGPGAPGTGPCTPSTASVSLLVRLGRAVGEGEGEVLAAAALSEGAIEGGGVLAAVGVAPADSLGLRVGVGVGVEGSDGDREGCRELLAAGVLVGVGVSAPELDTLGGAVSLALLVCVLLGLPLALADAEADSELLADGSAVPLAVGEGSTVPVPEAVGSAVPLEVAVVDALAPAEREEVAEADNEAVGLSDDEAEHEDDIVALEVCEARGGQGEGSAPGGWGEWGTGGTASINEWPQRQTTAPLGIARCLRPRAAAVPLPRRWPRSRLTHGPLLSIRSPQCWMQTWSPWVSQSETMSAAVRGASARITEVVLRGGRGRGSRGRPPAGCTAPAGHSALTLLLEGVTVPEALADTELVVVALSLDVALCGRAVRSERQVRKWR